MVVLVKLPDVIILDKLFQEQEHVMNVIGMRYHLLIKEAAGDPVVNQERKLDL